MGPSGRSWMSQRTLSRSGTSRETNGEVRDGSGDPLGSLGQVGVRRRGPERIAVPRGSTRRSGGPPERSGTSWETLGEVRVGTCYPRAGSGRVEDPPKGPGRVRGPSERSGTCRGTLGEVQDVSGDTRRGLGPVGGPLERSGTGRGTLGEVRDGSWDSRGGPGHIG